MGAAWQRSTVTHGHRSTLDLARDQKYVFQPVAGIKRHNDEFDVEPHARHSPHGQAVEHLPTRTTSHPPPRPNEPCQPPRLQASRIVPVVGGEYGQSVNAPRPIPFLPRISSTPGPSQNPLLSLRHPRYGLPSKLADNLEHLGVQSIYPWQSSCLLGRGMLEGEQNLVYTAPTGGGKSLVADVLMLRRIIENPEKKAMVVLPYVALVQEKLKWLRALVDGVGKNVDFCESQPSQTRSSSNASIRVTGFFGGRLKSSAEWPDCDVAVCTIEKANSMVNAAIEERKHAGFAAVVLDELHMLNEEHRGYILELLASKLLSLDSGVQIIGMSATLPNPQLLAKWLKAKFYIAKYRPVPIEEHLVYENEIYRTANAKAFFRTVGQLTAEEVDSTPRPKPCRTISEPKHQDLSNPLTNAVVALAVETALDGHGALVFCNSRLGAERTACLISDAMPTDQCDVNTLDKRQDLMASLQALPGGFEATFVKTILHGVGFHHAGLTTEERELVTEAYDTGVLKVMVATCGLAAGINLPARRVILKSARIGRELVGPAMLRQMRGRAGRKGKDEYGETYLCCHKEDLEAVAGLLEAEMPAILSCLTPEKRGITRALLEVVAVRMASSRASLDQYVHSSLLWHSTERDVVEGMVKASIQELLDRGLIQTRESLECLEPTALGTAVVAAGLSPEDGIFVHSELRRALESFVMDGDMHIFYLFTPVQTSGLGEIAWLTFRDELEQLDDSGMRALRLIGVSPAFVNRLVNSGAALKETTADEARVARVYRRVYSAFQLRDLCNEMPVHEISLKYSVSRGQVQTLAQTCHGFAAGMVQFCRRMGWGMLGAVLEHMLDRLRAGARADLLEMAQVAFVKSRMARIFWDSGLKSVRALGEADPSTLVPIMMQAHAWKTKLQGEAAERFKNKLLAKAEVIVGSANRIHEKQMMLEWEEE